MTRLSVLEVQASSNSRLTIPLPRPVNTQTLRETEDQRKRKQLSCLYPGIQLIMSQAMRATLSLRMLRTT